jgi:hypothetical protein
VVTPPTGGSAGNTPSKACTAFNNQLNKLPQLKGTAKITSFGGGFIKLGSMTINIGNCTSVSFTKGASKLKVGETATWSGARSNDDIVASSITIQP